MIFSYCFSICSGGARCCNLSLFMVCGFVCFPPCCRFRLFCFHLVVFHVREILVDFGWHSFIWTVLLLVGSQYCRINLGHCSLSDVVWSPNWLVYFALLCGSLGHWLLFDQLKLYGLPTCVLAAVWVGSSIGHSGWFGCWSLFKLLSGVRCLGPFVFVFLFHEYVRSFMK